MPKAPDELITVGKIVGAFGVKGWLKLKSFTQPEENIIDYLPWHMDSNSVLAGERASRKNLNENIEVECDAYNHRPQGLVIHLKGVDDRNSAEAMIGAEIKVARSALPALEENEFYWSQLIGLQVTSLYAGREVDFGEVVGMLETGANDVMLVREKNSVGKERLIPYLPEQFVESIDLESGQIVVKWDPDF